MTSGIFQGGGADVLNSGTIDIAAGETVAITGSLAADETINFTGPGGTLLLSDPLGFQGSVTGFVNGDAIDLIDTPSDLWAYNTTTGTLTVYGGNSTQDPNPQAASFALASTTTLTTQQIFVGQDGNGGSLIQLADIRNWIGGASGEWYSTPNWATIGTLAANSYPLFGDTAIIANGIATISAADFINFGSLDSEIVLLTGNGAGLQAVDGSFGSDLTITSAASQGNTSLVFDGTTVSEATIQVSGDNATLQFGVGSDGTVAGDFINQQFATIFVSGESALNIASGRLTNDGQIILNGAATIAAGATVDGAGAIDIAALGVTLTVAGSIGPSQIVVFADNQLNIAQGAQFSGIIENFSYGDTIDLQGIIANDASYDASSNLLTLRDNGNVVATLNVAGSYGATDFAATSDGNGGSFITDTIVANIATLTTTLPVSAVAAPGSSISLAQLLTEAFGANFLATDPEIGVWSPSQANLGAFSYWDPSQPALPYWTINGTIVAPDQVRSVLPSELASVDYVAGDLIQAGAFIQLPVAFSAGATTQLVDYDIQTFMSQFAQPSLSSGAPTPQDVVNAAEAFAAAYTNVPNTEDCYHIAHEVAAAAGAVMVADTGSTYPADNAAGGFWRIQYAAPQDSSAVANWSTLVEAGDILRIQWENSGGPHSFTVVAPLDQSGSITVFDNVYHASPGSFEAIGIHQVQYWNATNPEGITIFRLDPNQLYLVDYTADGSLIQNLPSAIVQGTTYNDLIIASGSADIMTGGGGNDVFADVSSVLNQATITDFHVGDTIDLTDLNSAVTSVDYDAATGLLTVISNGGTVADIYLPSHLTGQFEIGNDGGSAGLDGNTLGTLYGDLFVGPTPEGSAVTLVTCFAAGTRIATPQGEVPVERLAVGDSVLCANGETQRIAWIGRRPLDISRHPRPEQVLPVRIAAGAFGDALPTRPLLLSPDHAVFVDNVLIPIRYLTNGRTIAQVSASDMRSVTYYHIELPTHDVVLAENLPVESYLDTGNRDRFSNNDGPIALFPDFSSRVWEAQGCAPLRIVGPEVDAARARIRSRARLSGSKRRSPL